MQWLWAWQQLSSTIARDGQVSKSRMWYSLVMLLCDRYVCPFVPFCAKSSVLSILFQFYIQSVLLKVGFDVIDCQALHFHQLQYSLGSRLFRTTQLLYYWHKSGMQLRRPSQSAFHASAARLSRGSRLVVKVILVIRASPTFTCKQVAIQNLIFLISKGPILHPRIVCLASAYLQCKEGLAIQTSFAWIR